MITGNTVLILATQITASVHASVSVFDILYTIGFEFSTLMNSKSAGKYFSIYSVIFIGLLILSNLYRILYNY